MKMIETGYILNDTYKIIAPLGAGGGGTVFLAYHMRMKENVAVKLIRSGADAFVCSRAEADILKGLKNDFLPQVIDFAEDGNDVYTVMEYIEGKNFKQLIEGGRHFSEAQVIKYGMQLCSALKYLHSRVPPIIHSDIKPSNIMLTPYDNICLIDFNISMLSENGLAVPVGGTKNFAAPEQFRQIISAPIINAFHEETRFIDDEETELDSGSKAVSQTKDLGRAYIDIRTDIFGAGASLYYILTGRIPAAGKLDFRGINVSSKLKKCLSKAVCREPDGRFKNAAEFEDALSGKKGGSMKAISGIFAAALAVCGIGTVTAFSSAKKNEVQYFSESTGITADSFTEEAASSHTSKGTDEQTVTTEAAVSVTQTAAAENTEASSVTSSVFSSVTESMTSVSSKQTETAAATIVSTSVSTIRTQESSVQTTAAQTAGTSVQTVSADSFTSYYVSGSIRSKLTKQLSDGGYEVTWYWQNGLEKYIESYNAHNEIVNLRVIALETRQTSFFGKPDITSEGYTYVRKNDNADYPYVKYYIGTERDVTLQCYLDENMEPKMTRTYTVSMNEEGNMCFTWFDGSGKEIAYKEYGSDGSLV